MQSSSSFGALVGDTVEYDYYGARKAGLKAFLIDREDKTDGEIEEIHDLRDFNSR